MFSLEEIQEYENRIKDKGHWDEDTNEIFGQLRRLRRAVEKASYEIDTADRSYLHHKFNHYKAAKTILTKV